MKFMKRHRAPKTEMKRESDIGIAVAGCGTWGLNHVRVWSELGRLRAVCDKDASRLGEIRKNFPQVEASDDWDSLLRRTDISGIVLATPTPTHSLLAEQVLEANKDVLVEKPMALNAAEAGKLVRLAELKGRILMVGHVLEYHPAVEKMHELIAQGQLGKIQYIYSNRLNLGRIRMEENALWSFAPHDIAIILRILGTMPLEVSCQGANYLKEGVADVTLTGMTFPGNIHGHIFVSWLHPFKEHRMVFVGDKSMLVFDDGRDWPEKLVLFPHHVEWVRGQMPVARNGRSIPIALPNVEALKKECQAFLEAVTTRKKPLTDGEEGLRVVRVLEAADQSLRVQGAAVKLSYGAAFQESFFVHATATIDPGAEIGAGTKVWHYSHIMPGARVGKNCVLGQNVFVGKGVVIGDGVKIQNNVSVYEGVELEEGVFCGPSVVFTNVFNPRSGIDRKHELRHTLVRMGSTLGANCTIVCGRTIGRYAFVGAGAVVTKDIPDHALVKGNPARLAGWACECGDKLAFLAKEARCGACGKKYRQEADRSGNLRVMSVARLEGET